MAKTTMSMVNGADLGGHAGSEIWADNPCADHRVLRPGIQPAIALAVLCGPLYTPILFGGQIPGNANVPLMSMPRAWAFLRHRGRQQLFRRHDFATRN